MEYREKYEEWLSNPYFDEATKEELRAIVLRSAGVLGVQITEEALDARYGVPRTERDGEEHLLVTDFGYREWDSSNAPARLLGEHIRKCEACGIRNHAFVGSIILRETLEKKEMKESFLFTKIPENIWADEWCKREDVRRKPAGTFASVMHKGPYNSFGKSIEKLLRSADLEFHHLIDCKAYVYLWKQHPLAGEASISFEQLQEYPCLAFEQGDNSSFYLAEEILSTNEYPRLIRANDRATMLNLMVGLNGYTLCSGIICEELNGNEFAAVPFRDDERNPNSVMEIGYIVKKHMMLSDMGERYIQALEEYLRQE